MPEQSYPPARTVAPAVRAHFERHIAQARAAGHDGLAVVPEERAIEAVIEAAFWASLRREEGYIPKISLAYMSPDESVQSLRFDTPLPLQPSVLTRVSPAVERAGIHLAVWSDGAGFSVWHRACHSDVLLRPRGLRPGTA